MRLLRKIAITGALALTMTGIGLPGAADAEPACPDRPTARSFAWALDLNSYFRMPGGDFEDGGSSWTLSGGAGVLDGMNETVLPAAPTDSHALDLPSGSTAQAAPLCVSGTATAMRLFARSNGLLGLAVVVVTARDDAGHSQTVLSPAIPLTHAWSAPLLLFRLPLLGDGFTSVTIDVRSIGIGGIAVDDVFVDPLRQR